MDLYSSFIAKSRYCRYVPEKGRREHWDETVSRYFDFMEKHLSKNHNYTLTKELRKELEESVVNLETMPSMRALMTAGPALDRDHVAGYNCAYLVVDDPKSFDEAMYILLCFHPDTLVKCKDGDKRISDIVAGDEVMSFNESKEVFEWKVVTNQLKTPSALRPKVAVELDNGTTVKCTADHKWLTANRGYVEAQHLTIEDDLVSHSHEIYKHTNKNTGKSYIGHTSKGTAFRFKQHISSANSEGSSGYNSHFYKSIRKHGADAWVTEVVDIAYTYEEATSKEVFWIKELDTYENGYNLTLGGEGMFGYRWSDEQRKAASENAYERTPEHRENLRITLEKSRDKINASMQTEEYKRKARENNLGEKNPMFGTTKTEDEKERIRLKMLGEDNHFFGKHHSEETKKILSEKAKQNAASKPNPFQGKTHTEETKQKMREAWAKRSELSEDKEAA